MAFRSPVHDDCSVVSLMQRFQSDQLPSNSRYEACDVNELVCGRNAKNNRTNCLEVNCPLSDRSPKTSKGLRMGWYQTPISIRWYVLICAIEAIFLTWILRLGLWKLSTANVLMQAFGVAIMFTIVNMVGYWFKRKSVIESITKGAYIGSFIGIMIAASHWASTLPVSAWAVSAAASGGLIGIFFWLIGCLGRARFDDWDETPKQPTQ